MTTQDVLTALLAAGWRWERPGVLTNQPPQPAWCPVVYARCALCTRLLVLSPRQQGHRRRGEDVYCGAACQQASMRYRQRQARRQRSRLARPIGRAGEGP